MKKIIFDLDNTLLFISENWTINYQKFSDKYNLNVTPEELYDVIGTIESEVKDTIITNKFFCDYISDKLSVTITEDALQDLLSLYADIPLLNTDITYDILEYLSKKYELISYSNWFTQNQADRLKRYNLDKFFSKIYGWDILPIKPSKEGLKNIIGDNNIEDYIFIGDSIEYDIETPYSIGMNTIFYNRKNIKQDKYKEIFNIEELKSVL